MRVPLKWLAEYVDIDGLTSADIAARLNVTGTELEQIVPHGVLTPDTLVIGRVLSKVKHPDADKLSVCQVAIGEGDVAQIVCGAPNVAENQIVAVALPGTKMSADFTIKKAKLRGEASEGMICSARELGIGQEHDGILDLSLHFPGAEDFIPGTPLSDLIQHSDEVLELEVTPNRPDCLGIYGIAREVAAATERELKAAPWADSDESQPSALTGLKITVQTEGCKRFSARKFENVKIAPSPLWLQARLSQCGIRPINNVVDVTNYVMMLTGQPMHAFDAGQIAGEQLNVRAADESEKLVTLDGKERSLNAGDLVIEDSSGIVSLAGVMGGQRTEVSEATTSIILESACWEGRQIHKTAQKHGLFSESASRNAKGLSEAQTAWALRIASEMLCKEFAAVQSDGTYDSNDGVVAANQTIELRAEKLSQVIGAEVPEQQQIEILQKLGFEVSAGEKSLSVTVPPERSGDVTREIDLIEEIARLGVIADLKPTLPARSQITAATLTAEQAALRKAVDTLVGRGLQEVMGWSFCAADTPVKLGLDPDDPRAAAVVIDNPISSEHAVLRPTILGSLLDIGARIKARGDSRLRIFECGTVFRNQPDPRRPELPFEHLALAALVEGDVLQVKGLLDALMSALRLTQMTLDQTASAAFLHPARSGRIMLGDKVVGLIGEVHPKTLQNWELPQASVFMIDMDQVLPAAGKRSAFKTVGAFPGSTFDLAVLVDQRFGAAKLCQVAEKAGGELVEDVKIFDTYSGKGIDEGKVSLALRVNMRAEDRTLEDEDITGARTSILQALESEAGAVLRV